VVEDVDTAPLPPDDWSRYLIGFSRELWTPTTGPVYRAMDAREAWIERHAAELRRVLRDPQVRAEVVALLGGDDQEQRRQRRLAELATELDGMELTLRLRRNDE
jgi:hypothetical protein